jgi:hypothetical protein
MAEKFVLTLALILTFSPQEKEQQSLVFGFAGDGSANSVAQIFKRTADDSPSPGGEGRDEGGRKSQFLPQTLKNRFFFDAMFLCCSIDL